MPTEINTIGVLGGGVMGAGIAQVLAVASLQVTVRDLKDEFIEKARTTIVDGRYGFTRGLELGKVTRAQVDTALANLSFTTEMEDLKDVDLIIEAVPEDTELKRQVFAEADRVVKRQAIFASNTSGFAIAHLSQGVGRKERFAGMHWFSPALVMRLVELVYTPETAEETLQALEALCQKVGKTSIRVKDAPGSYGFVANRIYYAAVRESQKVMEEGIASVEDINKAMVYGFNWPIGPLAMSAQARKGWK